MGGKNELMSSMIDGAFAKIGNTRGRIDSGEEGKILNLYLNILSSRCWWNIQGSQPFFVVIS